MCHFSLVWKVVLPSLYLWLSFEGYITCTIYDMVILNSHISNMILVYISRSAEEHGQYLILSVKYLLILQGGHQNVKRKFKDFSQPFPDPFWTANVAARSDTSKTCSVFCRVWTGIWAKFGVRTLISTGTNMLKFPQWSTQVKISSKFLTQRYFSWFFQGLM